MTKHDEHCLLLFLSACVGRRLHASRIESEYKNVGGYDGVEIAYNKRVGEDRTEGSG